MTSPFVRAGPEGVVVRRRTSLTATFAVVSLVAMTLLGVVLTLVVAEMLRQQALDQAIRTATAYADSGIRDRIGEGEWETEQLEGRSIDRLRVNLYPDGTLVEVRLWGKTGKAMYDSVDLAHPFPDLARLQSAMNREPTAALVTQLDRKAGTGTGGDPAMLPGLETVLDVYVPVYAVPGVPIPYGVAEIALDYSATEAATASAVRTVAAVIGVLSSTKGRGKDEN